MSRCDTNQCLEQILENTRFSSARDLCENLYIYAKFEANASNKVKCVLNTLSSNRAFNKEVCADVQFFIFHMISTSYILGKKNEG